MTDERLQILTMVQEGKLSPEEAIKLLEALEPSPAREAESASPKPGKARHVRIRIFEGKKEKSFSVPIGLARWVLGVLPVVVYTNGDRLDTQQIDTAQILEAIDDGTTGKVYAAEEGQQRLEIWLDS